MKKQIFTEESFGIHCVYIYVQIQNNVLWDWAEIWQLQWCLEWVQKECLQFKLTLCSQIASSVGPTLYFTEMALKLKNFFCRIILPFNSKYYLVYLQIVKHKCTLFFRSDTCKLRLLACFSQAYRLFPRRARQITSHRHRCIC